MSIEISDTAEVHYAWPRIVNQALLGTGRKPFSTPAQDTLLGSILSGLDSSDQERALLSAASTVSLYNQAGYVPAVDSAPVAEPCEAEDLPRCSTQPGYYLSLILSGRYSQ